MISDFLRISLGRWSKMTEQNERSRCTAVLLAAGKGTRLGGDLPKQYRDIAGIPLAARSLEALASSEIITDIVMVIPEGDEEYIREHIFPAVPEAAKKVRAFANGGAERYHSVANGLEAISWPCSYVFIHDGARPFIDHASLERLYEAVRECGAAVAGMPSKDTVKMAGEDGYVVSTPDRSHVWIIQTPQVFEKNLITEAYREMLQKLPELQAQGIHITDDAMVAEQMKKTRIRLVEASYRNIKITTPEDIAVAEAFLS